MRFPQFTHSTNNIFTHVHVHCNYTLPIHSIFACLTCTCMCSIYMYNIHVLTCIFYTCTCNRCTCTCNRCTCTCTCICIRSYWSWQRGWAPPILVDSPEKVHIHMYMYMYVTVIRPSAFIDYCNFKLTNQVEKSWYSIFHILTSCRAIFCMYIPLGLSHT